MTVDITQEEMNILNLNGISKDSVRDNVQYMRASGKSDDEIRQYFTNTISELRPITKLSHNTTGKISEWENQGGITPYELAKKKSIVYTGKYDNIDENANLNWIEKKLKNSSYNETVENRSKTAEEKILERNKRVNEGTGSFLDRAGAALDRFGKASYQAQQGNTVDVTALKAGVDTKTGTVIDNRDKSKPIGFQEALSDSFMTGAWMPYIGGFVSKADEKKQREIQKHILNGEPIRPDEKAFLDKRLEEIQEARVRGYTLGGQIAESFLPSLIRFGAEIATGGALLEGLGLVSKVGEGASLTQKAVAGVGNMLKTGAVNTVLPTGWNDIYENYQTRRLNKELDFTEKGQAIFQEAEEKPATSFVKSIGQTFTMFASEASGELLNIPLKGATAAMQKYIGSPLYKYLSQNPVFKKFVDKTIPEISKYYEKINNLPIKGKNIDWLKSKVKFDGLLAEMGEEVIEDILNLTLGTGDEKRTLDNYINAIFKSPDEWAVIAGAIALQGMSLSAASHIIGNHMARNGATAEEIQEVMNNTTETDKENMVESIIENGALDLSNFNTSEERFKDSVSKLAKNISSASGNPIDQDKIDKISNMSVSMLAKIAEVKGLDVDDVIEKEMADIEQINDEMFVDENGNLQTVSQENNAPVDIDSKINQLLEDYENLGEDYDNQEDLDNRIAEISLLDKIKSGELSLEDMEAANDLIAKYEEQGDNEFAQYLKNEIDNPQKVHFQRADFAGSENSADIADAAKEWKENGTDSKYFKKWFGDSKVVDENGKPRVVYHGTNADFDKFEIGDVGFHFGNYEQANERMTDFSDGNPHIMSGYLKMENPLDIVSDVGDWLDVDTVKEYLHEYEVLSDEEFKNVNTLSQITSLLQNKGYDGIIYENQFEGKGKSYIVFNSSQFKSVANRGTFDANNPSIYYQTGIEQIDNSEKYKNLPQDLKEAIDYIFNGKSVYNVTGQEFPNNGEKFSDLIDKIAKFYKDNFNGKVNIKNFGEVLLDKKSVKNTSYHNFNTNKVNAFAAVPYVLQNGKVAHYDENYKGKNEDRYLFVAPITIEIDGNKEEYFCEVVVKATDRLNSSGVKRFYLHEIELKEKLADVFLTPFGRTSTSSKSIIADLVNNFNPNVNNHEDRNRIENIFGDSVENITEGIKADIENIIAENDLSENDFNIVDVQMYGSYTTGRNKQGSDIDFLVEYTGDMSEDSAFNMFADAGLEISDKDSNPVKVDINPIRADKSGTIAEFLERNKDYNKPDILYQKANKNSSGQLSLFDDFMQLNLFKQEQIFDSQKDNTQPVQTEIKKSYSEKDVQEKQQNDNISDVGDSLLGNLKRNKKQYTWQELEDMNDLLRKKYLSKSYIYQLPSVEEFKKQGLSDNAIAYINLIYSKINSKPAKNFDTKIEHQKIYFDSVQDIMTKTIDFVKNNKEYFNTLSTASKRNDDLFKTIYPDKENKNRYNIFVAYPEYNLQAIITGGNKLVGAMQIGYSTIKDIEKYANILSTKKQETTEKKETLVGWQKRLEVVNTYKGWVVADRKSGMMITQGLPSKDNAEKLAELIYNEINNNSANFTDNYEMLRDYIPRRENNQNVKPEALIEVFGFRGINFGNWTKQQERQDFINSAYDSLYDLAELLNVPPKALSLGGKLGLAFGAQGRSGAAGHFIPEYNEINLTRKSGAGSLAHEWWHALDYYFGDQSKGKDFSGTVSLSLSDKGELREEVFEALKKIKEEITYAPLTEDEIQNKSSYLKERAEKRIKYWADDIKKTFAKSKNADKIVAFIDNIVDKAKTVDTSDDSINQEYISLIDERRKTWDNLSKISNLIYSISNLQKVNEVAAASKKYTTYYENAIKLNDIEKGHGKGYWSSSTELGARAFSSYILNKMAEKNFRNNFLARDEQMEKSLNILGISERIQAKEKGEEYKGNEKTFIEWYPAEPEERKRIFAAFDNLFGNLKTKDQGGNVILYQNQKQNKLFVDNERAEQITNRLTKIKGSFIPAENLIQLFKDADESTIVHEFAHWWLEKLQKYAEDSEELQQDLAEIRKFVKNNGEPFTEEQHERFARGFEAYMRTGSAKTNRLKKLFEDFKNALLSLYDSIRSLGFSEDEIPEINNLFDRLLTTENQRIQAAVFDRCNTLQAQIDEIKANQEKELAEIDDIQATDMFSREEEARKKKQINEYLLAAETAANRLPKETKEYQKRYKDATFAILEAATGYKRQFIANPRNWETVQDKIETTDSITSSNGMLPEWAEFYVDEGVSYDNEDINGDYNIASKAFDVMRDGTYLPMNTDEYEEVSKFFGKLDYLSGKVMSLRGENKELAMQAVDKLISTMPTLPDFAAHELVDKVEELHSTFIEQVSKENTKNLKELTNVPLSMKLRMFVTDKLNETKSYDPVGKRYIRLSEVNKLYKMLKYATNASDTKEIIRTINAHAIKQLENRQKGILHKEIQKQVKINSKLIKVGALKQGKFDWKTNTVFAELQQMNRLSIEDARKEYNRLINADAAVLGEERDNIDDNPTATLEAPTDFQSVLKTKFLEYKTNRVNDLNLQATRSLLEDILELKFEGRRAKNEAELKKALSRYDYQTNLVSILYANKDNKAAKYLARWVGGDTIFTSEGTLANWESLLNAVFNRETAQKYSLLKDEADVEVYAHEHVKEFYKKALDIYGLNTYQKGKLVDVWNRALDFDNTQPIVKLFQDYENEVYQFKQNTFNKDTGDFVETNVDITHAQLITLYAWSLNPELKKRIITQFIGEDVEDADQLLEDLLFSKLSEQDKQFAWAMIDVCDSMYNDTNEVFIRTTGLSLPRTDNYIPSKTERIGSDLDMMHETILRSTNPSFIKQRKNCRRIKMNPQSPLAIIIPHINKTARYVVMSEKVNFYNRIFQAPDVKAALVDVFGKKSGEKIHRVILNQLATSTYDNYARSITVGKNLLDTIASNYITSRIGGNLKVMFSQLTSVINYAENMPAHEWAIGFKDALAHPKDTIDYMFKNCPYLQARLAGNSQNEIISQLTNESDKFRTLRNFCTANTKYGDILAIMFGGKPYVEYLMKQGMTQEEAFSRFVEDTLRSQQSGHHSATSAWQKSVAQNAITRMIFAFNNTNFQYERKWVDAMSKLAKGDISKQEFAKAFLIYKVFNPILFTSFLTDLSLLILIQNLLGGDDDWYKNFGADIIGAISLSQWKAYGILGLLANAIIGAVNAKFSGGMFFENSLPLISDFETSMKKILNSKKLEFSDYIEMIAGAGDYTTGIAATRLYNVAGGVGDVAKGDFGTGLLRILGYGKYRATLGATGHPPERKRK